MLSNSDSVYKDVYYKFLLSLVFYLIIILFTARHKLKAINWPNITLSHGRAPIQSLSDGGFFYFKQCAPVNETVTNLSGFSIS